MVNGVTKHPASALRDLVPMAIMVSSALLRVRQNVTVCNVILIQVTATVVLIDLSVQNVSIHVLSTANHALTRLCVISVSLDFMANVAIETVHSVVAAVDARSRVGRVKNIFAKKTITVQNAQKSVDHTVRGLVYFLTDDVLQSAL